MNRTALGIDDFFEIFVIILMLSTKELFTEEATPGEYNNLLFTFFCFFSFFHTLNHAKQGRESAFTAVTPRVVFLQFWHIFGPGGSCRGGVVLHAGPCICRGYARYALRCLF